MLAIKGRPGEMRPYGERLSVMLGHKIRPV